MTTIIDQKCTRCGVPLGLHRIANSAGTFHPECAAPFGPFASQSAEILRLRSRVEELEGALKNAEPIAELLRTVSSFLDGWIFADIKPDGEQIQREADGLRTDVDVALAYSPVFSALSPSTVSEE